jgi:hypothetical protein
MKLIATEGGRVLDLVPLEELRPPNGIYIPDFIQKLYARYGFSSPSPSLADAVATGVKFEHGKFDIDGTTHVIKELSIYSDGLIGDCFNTHIADLLLDDFLTWGTETYKFRPRQTPLRRTYTSAIIVQFEKLVEPALGKLARLTTVLSNSLKSAYGWNYQYNLVRLNFQVDPTTIPALRSTQFFIERKLGAPYEENRYYSVAPFRTEEHIRILEAVETELLA